MNKEKNNVWDMSDEDFDWGKENKKGNHVNYDCDDDYEFEARKDTRKNDEDCNYDNNDNDRRKPRKKEYDDF
ncbi:hypothetical protein SAMN04487886_100820 [Clostridium sp. DSM 8431]|uniref:hypothetical protein n=1 Tax=Clostridium sp. DSM 8431 TaxID=1761781 RepID=UPI0008EA52EF|nr:hypothetical protein [Clostridium sp. DSM 8431]SFU33112.1 hypothetical protein SAMN04487886_100820 [Clostridium sp. DSM 8431]